MEGCRGCVKTLRRLVLPQRDVGPVLLLFSAGSVRAPPNVLLWSPARAPDCSTTPPGGRRAQAIVRSTRTVRSGKKYAKASPDDNSESRNSIRKENQLEAINTSITFHCRWADAAAGYLPVGDLVMRTMRNKTELPVCFRNARCTKNVDTFGSVRHDGVTT